MDPAKTSMPRRYLKDKRALHFIKKLKQLDILSLKRQEIFFAMNLKGFKKSKIKGGK